MEESVEMPVIPPVEEDTSSRNHNYSLEAERYVLGCVLLDSDAVVEVIDRQFVHRRVVQHPGHMLHVTVAAGEAAEAVCFRRTHAQGF